MWDVRNDFTRTSIRGIFLNPQSHQALITVADLLGMSLPQLKHEITDGTILTFRTGGGAGHAGGDDRGGDESVGSGDNRGGAWAGGGAGSPGGDLACGSARSDSDVSAREMLRWLARRDETTVNCVLARQLEDVACAHSEELAGAVPGLEAALSWPEPASV